jgi:hypothetical protein
VKKFVLNTILFFGLCAALFWPLAMLFENYFNSHPIVNKTNWILGIKQKSYDYAVIGSSDIFRGIDVKVIEKKTGLKGINLAQDGTCMEENLAIFKKFIGQNKIKSVFISVFTREIGSEHKFPVNCEKYIPYLSDTIFSGLVQNNAPPGKAILWRYLPFFKYAEYNTQYNYMDVLKDKQDRSLFLKLDSTGGAESLTNEGHAFTEWKDQLVRIHVDPALADFIDYAKSKAIRVGLITSPHLEVAMNHILNKDTMFRAISEISASRNIPYFNFSDPDFFVCRERSYFRDHGHLNTSGAAEFSKAFADTVAGILQPITLQNRN